MNVKNAVAPWFLYVIKTVTGALYTGISTDFIRRFGEHSAQNSKTAKSLRGKAPLVLVYCVTLNSHGEALKAELWVKKQTRAAKLKLLDGTTALPFEHKVIPLPLSESKDVAE